MLTDFREGKGERGERESNMDVKHWLVASWTKDWTCNPGVYPDLESNQQPFGAWDNAPIHQVPD